MEINSLSDREYQKTDRQFVLTADGSKTLYDSRAGSHFHSVNGAVQESRHVFLESGLKYFLKKSGKDSVSILEAGFGTGLNFLLSTAYCQQNKISMRYTGIEAYPLTAALICQSEYHQYVNKEIGDSFISTYDKAMQEEISFPPFIQLEIIHQKLLEFNIGKLFDILYFDAFSAGSQPEMWTLESLGHICRYLHQGSVFITYAMNGNLKRNMSALGFRLEKVPGAPGKREMLRAILSETPSV